MRRLGWGGVRGGSGSSRVGMGTDTGMVAVGGAVWAGSATGTDMGMGMGETVVVGGAA